MPAHIDEMLGEPDNLGCIYERQMKRMPDPSYSQIRQVTRNSEQNLLNLIEYKRIHWHPFGKFIRSSKTRHQK